MNMESYRFRVGQVECLAVPDGSNIYDVKLLFANAPEDELREALGESVSAEGEIDVPYTCLAAKVEGSWLLVDTGRGLGREPSTGKLVQNLQRAGIEPTEIKMVILTHGHTDHIGGLTDEVGRLVFPKAKHVMSKGAWHFWTDQENLAEMGWEEIYPFMKSKLLPVEEKVTLIEGEKEIGPGVRVVPVAGHTPGHMAVVISSGGEEVWSTGDALIHPLHLERLEWYTVYDIEPEESLRARRWVLDEVSSKGALVHAFHFPFPGIGRAVRVGDHWRWQPVEEE